jgi:hypothetical protein
MLFCISRFIYKFESHKRMRESKSKLRHVWIHESEWPFKNFCKCLSFVWWMNWNYCCGCGYFCCCCYMLSTKNIAHLEWSPFTTTPSNSQHTHIHSRSVSHTHTYTLSVSLTFTHTYTHKDRSHQGSISSTF